MKTHLKVAFFGLVLFIIAIVGMYHIDPWLPLWAYLILCSDRAERYHNKLKNRIYGTDLPE